MKLFSLLMATLCIAAATAAGNAAECQAAWPLGIKIVCADEVTLVESGLTAICSTKCQTAIDAMYGYCQDQVNAAGDQWDPTMKTYAKVWAVKHGCSSASTMAPAMLTTTAAALFAAFQY